MSTLTGSPLAAATTADEAQVRRDDRAHVFHSWSAQALIDPLPIASASGSTFTDYGGKTYLDFSSQLVNVNIGYQHPRLVAAIQEQAARLCTIQPSFANDARSEAARLIAELAPGSLSKVFFTNGGAEANDNAIRMARLHTGRPKVLATYRSYHGATNGAIMLTGDPRRWPSEPGMGGVVHFWGPYTYRSAFHAETDAQECERALQHLREVIMVEGAATIAAIILETVVGTNGILVPPDGYLAGVRQICDEFRLRAARRRHHLRGGGGELRAARLPGRSHLLGAPVGVRVGRGVDRDLQGRGHSRTRPDARDRRHRAGADSPRGEAPQCR